MSRVNFVIDEANDRAHLGEALALLRAQSGLTQLELAERLGVDPTYISQVELGRRGVRWHTVMRFLAGLEANLRQLADELTPPRDRAVEQSR
jgi:transcriptional regulator with XRE-family HTH domain